MYSSVLHFALKFLLSRDLQMAACRSTELSDEVFCPQDLCDGLQEYCFASYAKAHVALSLLASSAQSFDGYLRESGQKKRLRALQQSGSDLSSANKPVRENPSIMEALVSRIISRCGECYTYTGLVTAAYKDFEALVAEAMRHNEVITHKQIPLRVRIFVAMAFLRGIAPGWLHAATRVPEGTMVKLLHECLGAITDVSARFLRRQLPSQHRKLAHSVFGGSLGSVVGAVDGFTIRIQESPGKPASRHNVHHGVPGHDFLLICDLTGVPLDVIEMGRGSRSETANAILAVQDLQAIGVLQPGDKLVGDAIYWHCCPEIVAPDKPTHMNAWANTVSAAIVELGQNPPPSRPAAPASMGAAPSAAALTAAGTAMLFTLDVTQHMISSVRLVVENCVNSLKAFNPMLSDRHPHHPALGSQDIKIVCFVKAIAGIVAFRMMHRGFGLRNAGWLALKTHGADALQLCQHAMRALRPHSTLRTSTLDTLPRLMRVRRDRRARQLLYSRFLFSDAESGRLPASVEGSPDDIELQAALGMMGKILNSADDQLIAELDMKGIPFFKSALAHAQSAEAPAPSARAAQPRPTKAARKHRGKSKHNDATQNVVDSSVWFDGSVLQYKEAIPFGDSGLKERGYVILYQECRPAWSLYYYHENGDEECDSDGNHLYTSMVLLAERSRLLETLQPTTNSSIAMKSVTTAKLFHFWTQFELHQLHS